MHARRRRLEAQHHGLVLALGHGHFLRAFIAEIIRPVQAHQAVHLRRVPQLDAQRKFSADENFLFRQHEARDRDVGVDRIHRADAVDVHASARPRIAQAHRRFVPFDLLRVGENVDFKPRRRAVLEHRHRALEGLLDRAGGLGFLDARHRAEEFALLFFIRSERHRQLHVGIIYQQHHAHRIPVELPADERLRGLDGDLHFRFIAARDARHRTRVVDHDHLRDTARAADAVPNGPQQREQQEQHQQRAQQQHEPLLHLAPRAQPRADPLEKHQRGKRPLALPNAQEQMENHRRGHQRQQPLEQRVEQDEVHRVVATPSWPVDESRRPTRTWCSRVGSPRGSRDSPCAARR